MKNRMLYGGMIALGAVALCGPAARNLPAQTPAPVVQNQPAQLSQGVQEVLRLVQGNVSEDTITAFINSSGLPFNLSSADILYLRQQGVSDAVINAMLNAPRNAQVAPQPVQAAPVPDASVPSAGSVTPSAPGYTATAPVYQPAPAYSYTAPTFGYYSGAPYYWNWSVPTFSIGIGLGGGYHGHWGGYHGYYRGGGYHGGGYYGHWHR